jgi:hypothetical protein
MAEIWFLEAEAVTHLSAINFSAIHREMGIGAHT